MVRVADLVPRANALLRIVGKEGFESLDELKRSACSMFVYLFERLFEARLEGVTRRPALKADYAQNADIVLQALSEMTGDDLSDILGAELASGSTDHLDALLDVFERIVRSNHSPRSSDDQHLYDEEQDEMDVGDEKELEREYFDQENLRDPYGEGETGEEYYEEVDEEEDLLRQYEGRDRRDSYDENGIPYEVDEGYRDFEQNDNENFDDYSDVTYSNHDEYEKGRAEIEAEDMYSEDLEDEGREYYYRARDVYEPSVDSSEVSEDLIPNKRMNMKLRGSSRRTPALDRLQRTIREQVPALDQDLGSTFTEEDLGTEDDDLLERIVGRFPQQLPRSRIDRRMQSIRNLAMHRTTEGSNTHSAELARQRERDKGRFRKAYESIIDDERREERLHEDRRKLMDRLERRRQQHEERVERMRLRRLGEDLNREAKARRERRKEREDAIVRQMFDEALAIEKERVLRAKTAASEQRARDDERALRRYEAARKVYEDKKDMLDEELKAKQKAEAIQKRNRQEYLRKLSNELKEDFDRKLRQARVALDAQEERVFSVNTQVIERAFSALNDTRAAFYQATISSAAG